MERRLRDASLLRTGLIKKLKFQRKVGSPRPNAGEGLGVRGIPLTRQMLADQCLVGFFGFGNQTQGVHSGLGNIRYLAISYEP
jgi:hypothetical protein